MSNGWWYKVRKFFGQLTYDEEQEESAKRLRQSLGVDSFDLAADMKVNPLKYGTPISIPSNIQFGPVTQGPENIPGPHPKPFKSKRKRPVRSITDDWEVTQDS